VPLFPWHRLVTCSHLLFSCGASFACLFVVLSPSGTPVLVVFGRAFLALCLFVVFSLFPFLLWLLCVVFGLWVFSACVFAVVFSLAFVCCLLCCGAASPPFLFGLFVAGFVVLCGGSPPAGCCLPPPHRLFPCGVLVQFLCWSLPLVSGCFMQQPGCLALMPGVWWCFASSLHFASWQLRPLALCGVLCYPLHHGAFVVVELCAPALRYSSSDDPGPPLDTAKLHTRHSRLHV